MIWTPEAEQHLCALVADPRGLSAGQMAKELGNGYSRNAVIGKCKRLGLTLPNHGIRRAAVTKSPRTHPNRDNLLATRIRAKSRAAQNAYAAVASIPAPDSRNLTFRELDRRECRWATNDAAPGESHLFCGAKAVRGEPYCAFHCRRSLAPPRAA